MVYSKLSKLLLLRFRTTDSIKYYLRLHPPRQALKKGGREGELSVGNFFGKDPRKQIGRDVEK